MLLSICCCTQANLCWAGGNFLHCCTADRQHETPVVGLIPEESICTPPAVMLITLHHRFQQTGQPNFLSRLVTPVDNQAHCNNCVRLVPQIAYLDAVLRRCTPFPSEHPTLTGKLPASCLRRLFLNQIRSAKQTLCMCM